jgi:hypothetical protein
LIFVGHNLAGGELGRVPLAAELHDLRANDVLRRIGGIWSNITMLVGENSSPGPGWVPQRC